MNRKALVIGCLVFATGVVAGTWVSRPARQLDTPFDHIDAKTADQYRMYYSYGHAWAQGQHTICPPNPTPNGEYAWVAQSWVAGFMAGRAAGGTSPIPARYLGMVPADVPVQQMWFEGRLQPFR